MEGDLFSLPIVSFLLWLWFLPTVNSWFNACSDPLGHRADEEIPISQLCKMGELFLCSKAAVIISELSWTDFDSAAAKYLTCQVPSYSSCSTWVLREILGPGMQATAVGWL